LQNPSIIYADTYCIIAHYLPKYHRIEASIYLKNFPNLHDFCINHEIQHALIEKKYNLPIFRHLWLDLKSRFKLYWDPTLFGELREFFSLTNRKTVKKRIEKVLYEFLTSFTMIIGIVSIRHLLSRKNISKIGRWIFDVWKT